VDNISEEITDHKDFVPQSGD